MRQNIKNFPEEQVPLVYICPVPHKRNLAFVSLLSQSGDEYWKPGKYRLSRDWFEVEGGDLSEVTSPQREKK